MSSNPWTTFDGIRITREDVAKCNAHMPAGPALGCPMCFLRAEHALVEFSRRHPDEVSEVLDSANGPIKAQILRQESES